MPGLRAPGRPARAAASVKHDAGRVRVAVVITGTVTVVVDLMIKSSPRV